MTLAQRKPVRQLGFALLALAALAGCGQSGSRQVEVNEPWASATPSGATVAAVYMEVTADERDSLLAATTTVADRIEMHTSSEENGMMRMRPLSTVELQAGETFVFAPGGAHFMLLGLRQPLRAGMRFPVTLQFEKAGTRNIQVDVKELGSR